MKRLRFILGMAGENFFFDYINDIDRNIVYHTELPLTEETKNSFTKWCETLESIYNPNDPASSDFNSSEDENKWSQEGKILFEKIKSELGNDYQVEFPKLDS